MPELTAEAYSRFATLFLDELAPLVRERVPEEVTYRYIWRTYGTCEVVLSATQESIIYTAEVTFGVSGNRSDVLTKLSLQLSRKGAHGVSSLTHNCARDFTMFEQELVGGFLKDVAGSVALFFEHLYPPTLLEFSPWGDRLRKPVPKDRPLEIEPLRPEQLAVFTHENVDEGLKAFEIVTAFPEVPDDHISAGIDWLIYGRDGDTSFRLPVTQFGQDLVKKGNWYVHNTATGIGGVVTSEERIRMFMPLVTHNE